MRRYGRDGASLAETAPRWRQPWRCPACGRTGETQVWCAPDHLCRRCFTASLTPADLVLIARDEQDDD